MKKLFVCGAFVSSLMLAGCQEPRNAASIKGACDAFERPNGVVLGKRRIDQRQIDSWIETGVSVCGWSRPKSQEIVNRFTS